MNGRCMNLFDCKIFGSERGAWVDKLHYVLGLWSERVSYTQCEVN